MSTNAINHKTLGLKPQVLPYLQRAICPKVQKIRSFFRQVSSLYFDHVERSFQKAAEVSEAVNGLKFQIPESSVLSIISSICKKLSYEKKDKRFFDFALEMCQHACKTYNNVSVNEEDVEDIEECEAIDVIVKKWIYKNWALAERYLATRIAVKTLKILPEMGKVSIPVDQQLVALSCFDYAFWRVGEVRAFAYDFSAEELPRLLLDWDYEIVTEPQSGDLVLFLDEEVATHLGVFYKGLIESKWGNARQVAFLHRIEDAPESYGTQILFYRLKS